MLRLFNTFGRKKEVFKPLKSVVSIYTCGPTVYWYQHIGNLRVYVMSDILKRVLLYNGYKIKHVMNLTDVGHLTSDADTGEDKMEVAAHREHKSASAIADFYYSIFNKDSKKLNILQPDITPKATDNIKEQIDMIKILEKKGYTYKTSDGVYFDSTKFPRYGEMAKLNIEELRAGKRIKMGEKKNKTDFSLWKFSPKDSKRKQEWDSPWGVGFPGWHIECSAMATKYLGKRFDIHTGGEDHIPIHHTNEIAQSESALGVKPWVSYWIHGAFLTTKGKKVSKSKGGLYTLSDLEEHGYNPLDYRYLCLLTHYRKNLEFSFDALKAAMAAYKSLKNKIAEINPKEEGAEGKKHLKAFESAINDDLNIPLALQALQGLLRDRSVSGKAKLALIKGMDTVFGLDLLKRERVSAPAEVKKLINERKKARRDKDWKLSDSLRMKIKKLGYWVDDTSEGPVVKKI